MSSDMYLMVRRWCGLGIYLNIIAVPPTFTSSPSLSYHMLDLWHIVVLSHGKNVLLFFTESSSSQPSQPLTQPRPRVQNICTNTISICLISPLPLMNSPQRKCVEMTTNGAENDMRVHIEEYALSDWSTWRYKRKKLTPYQPLHNRCPIRSHHPLRRPEIPSSQSHPLHPISLLPQAPHRTMEGKQNLYPSLIKSSPH